MSKGSSWQLESAQNRRKQLLDFIGISGSIQEILSQLKSKNISNAAYAQGLAELEAVCGNIKALA